MARCLHGLDERFCAICTRNRRGFVGSRQAPTRQQVRRRLPKDIPAASQWAAFMAMLTTLQQRAGAAVRMCIHCHTVVPFFDSVQAGTRWSGLQGGDRKVTSRLEDASIRVGCRVKIWEEVETDVAGQTAIELRGKIIPMSHRGLGCLLCQELQRKADSEALDIHQADEALFNAAMSDWRREHVMRMGTTPSKRLAYIDVTDLVMQMPKAERPVHEVTA